MKEFIAQRDEICLDCGEELPKGSWINITEYNDVLCDSCRKNCEEVGGENKMD